ncbi:hypothetical protein AKJ51_04975, partial [candidate division MSBL1 archaeon SCGC-AAA382A20]
RFDSDSERIKVGLKLPKQEDGEDWIWYRFSASPNENVKELLEEERIRLGSPVFGSKGESKYYLEFPVVEVEREEVEGKGWGFVEKLALIGVVVLLTGLFTYFSPATPLTAVTSQSMEPTLNRGDLIITRPNPGDIQAGDIIIVEVPEAYQRKYNYPSRFVHRVKDIDGNYIETAGDKSGEDPFKSRFQDVVGKYTGLKIPYLGFVVILLQSIYGVAYITIVMSGWVLYDRLPSWLEEKEKRERRVNEALEKTAKVHDSLKSLSNSINIYARHLRSHTSAVQNLSKSSEKTQEATEKLAQTSQKLDSILNKLDEKLEK